MTQPFAPFPGLGVSSKGGGGSGPAGAALDILSVQAFGAVGDGVHDDTTAIQATIAAAISRGGVVYYPGIQPDGVTPVVAYMVASETLIQSPVFMVGHAANDHQIIIRASAAMRSIFAMNTTHTGASGTTTAQPAEIHNLTFDGNSLANYCILRIGDFLTRYIECNCIRFLQDGMHAAAHVLPVVISAITPGGGNTSPVPTLSQPDINYAGLPGGVNTFVLTVDAAGVRGVAKYALNLNGGGTATADQFVQPVSNICVTSGALYNWASGIQAAFPAGNYAHLDTWTFTVNVQTADGTTDAINADARVEDCWFKNGGSIAGSVGAIGSYTALALSVVTAPGTVSTTTFGQIVQGSGTQFLSAPGSIPARPGDLMWIATQGNFPIACVLDDLQIAIPKNSPIILTGAALDYAIGTGAGYWEDDNAENVRTIIDKGVSSVVPVCYRTTGGAGGGVDGRQSRCEVFGFSAVVVGGLQNVLSTFLWQFLHIETGGASSNAQAVFLSGKCIGGLFIEPPENFPLGKVGGLNNETLDSGPGAATVIRDGTMYGLGLATQTSLQTATELYVPSAQTITAAGQQILAPSTAAPYNTTSLIFLDSNADYVLSNAHTIQPPGSAVGNSGGFDGTSVLIINVGAHKITFQNRATAGTNLNMPVEKIVLEPWDSIRFMSQGSAGNWALAGTTATTGSLMGVTATTVGAAGAASALPAQPLKYIRVFDETGTLVAIPAYNP
jgi:pectate lyase-like protein